MKKLKEYIGIASFSIAIVLFFFGIIMIYFFGMTYNENEIRFIASEESNQLNISTPKINIVESITNYLPGLPQIPENSTYCGYANFTDMSVNLVSSCMTHLCGRYFIAHELYHIKSGVGEIEANNWAKKRGNSICLEFITNNK
jgi:hypothetical protein